MEETLEVISKKLWNKFYIQEEHSTDKCIELTLRWMIELTEGYAHPLLIENALKVKIENYAKSGII